MTKPLNEDEKKLLAGFLRGIVQGTVSLGFGSLDMLAYYKRAQASGQSMFDILTTDPQVCVDIANACKKSAARLPAQALTVIKQVIEEAQELQRGQPAGAGADEIDV